MAVQDFIDKLRDDSVYIKLQSNNKFGGAIDIESLITALKSLSQSYKSFVEIELGHKADIKSGTKAFQTEKSQFIAESELLIVDLDFASFGAAIAPNTATSSDYIVIKDSLRFKNKAFLDYRHNVLELNYSDKMALNRIAEKYSAEERREIYKPIFDNLINSRKYKFYYGNNKNSLKPLVSNLSLKDIEKFVPKKVAAVTVKKDEEMFVMYFTTSDQVDLFGKTPKISRVLATTKMEQPIYPFQIQRLDLGTEHILFRDTLSAEVRFEDDVFYINHPALNILVWGESRQEAESAFMFALNSSLKNIYYSEDKNLTSGAIAIKKVFNAMIKTST